MTKVIPIEIIYIYLFLYFVNFCLSPDEHLL